MARTHLETVEKKKESVMKKLGFSDFVLGF